MYQKSRAWIELDMTNLEKNVAFFRRTLPEGCRLMPAVKANAYGHGAVPVSRELQRLGITDYCVASAEEGKELREAGIGGTILVLGYTHPREFGVLEAYHLTQTVVDMAYAKSLKDCGKELDVHVGIDTGMHRLGIPWEQAKEITELQQANGIHITGVFSHLCMADGRGAAEEEVTRQQIARFDAAVNELRAAGMRKISTHLQSSYGVLNYPECRYDLARIGIALYGVKSRGEDVSRVPAEVFPVLSLKSRIACIQPVPAGEGAGYGHAFSAERDSRIAVLSIGYADGIPRNLAGKGYVLIGGKRAYVVGRVCMDQMLVDVTDLPEAEPESEAVLIGTSGGAEITAEMYAEWGNTIANEIVSRLGTRLERIVCNRT